MDGELESQEYHLDFTFWHEERKRLGHGQGVATDLSAAQGLCLRRLRL